MDWPGPLATVEEVDIQTSPTRRTTIWPVVEEGEVYVRSLRGERGLWYRELVAHPDAILYVDGEAVPVRGEVTPDPQSVERATAGLRRKYAGSPYLDTMIRAEILATTVRLSPR
jgi:hypothetical protein